MDRVVTRTGRSQGRWDGARYSPPSYGWRTLTGPRTPRGFGCSGIPGRWPRLCCTYGSLCGRLGVSGVEPDELETGERQSQREQAWGLPHADAEMRKPSRAPTSTFVPAVPPSQCSLLPGIGRFLLKYQPFREACSNYPPLSVPLACFIFLPIYLSSSDILNIYF